MENSKKRGSRVIGALIVFLVILFIVTEFFIQKSQEFSPTQITNILLFFLYNIVLLLALIILFVLSRNLIKLYLERKRKVIGARFKTKLVLFFTALSFIPTLLLFFFASDLIGRNIEQWFKTPIDIILRDTKSVSDGFYINSEEITLHYSQQLGKTIQKNRLIYPENRQRLMNFIREKLTEYKLDEISIYVEEEELFAYLSANLPLQYYQNLKTNVVKRALLGEEFRSIESMGKGEIIRTGISFNIPEIGSLLVITGKFLPQNYAQKLSNISSYVERYRQLKIQKNPVKTFYLLTLIFITLLIIFAASWIGFHLAKSITVPIEKLAQATKEVSKGNLAVKVEDPASDELGILIESFNQMVSDLSESQRNIAQKTSELEGRRQYIEIVLDNIPTGVITLNSKGIITTINPSAREMLALSDENLVGKNCKDVLSDEKYQEILKNIQTGLKNKYKLSDREITISVDGQNTTVSLTLSLLKQPDNKFSGMVVVLDNLTQLIKAQKIAAWKEVAQRVAHEIKNPLTPIQLSAERIIKNLKKKEKNYDHVIKDGAKTIVDEARTIKSLVDEFSNFARMPAIKLEPADIHQIIEQTVTPFRGIFSDIEFELLFSTDVPSPVQIDPEQMKRVFINLIDNAIDAMNKKGRIKIQTIYDKHQSSVKIEVSDSGPGIQLDDKERFFLPNFSTKKKGTGLGLAIVNRIINEHNGTIMVEENKPGGVRFIIHIPV